MRTRRYSGTRAAALKALLRCCATRAGQIGGWSIWHWDDWSFLVQRNRVIRLPGRQLRRVVAELQAKHLTARRRKLLLQAN